MFPMDPLRNITFLAKDIDRNVGGPPKRSAALSPVGVQTLAWRSDESGGQRRPGDQYTWRMSGFVYLYHRLSMSWRQIVSMNVINLQDDLSHKFSGNMCSTKIAVKKLVWGRILLPVGAKINLKSLLSDSPCARHRSIWNPVRSMLHSHLRYQLAQTKIF